MEISRSKEECWELTECVVSSIVDGGYGVGSVGTHWHIMLLDQMAKRVKSGHCFQMIV